MKKTLFGILMFAFGLLSCDKESNASRGLAYISDDEFVNNDNNWNLDTVFKTRRGETRPVLVKFIDPEENGRLNVSTLQSSGSWNVSYFDTLTRAINPNVGMSIDLGLSYVPITTENVTAEQLASNYSGIVLNFVSGSNYDFFTINKGGQYAIRLDGETYSGAVDETGSYRLSVVLDSGTVVYKINNLVVLSLGTDQDLSKTFTFGMTSNEFQSVNFLYLRLGQ